MRKMLTNEKALNFLAGLARGGGSRVGLIVATCIFLAGWTPAHAGSKDGKLDIFLKSRAYNQRLYTMASGMDRKLGIFCKDGEYVIRPWTFMPLKPITFATDKSAPVSGTWYQRFTVARCGEDKIYNTLAIAKGDTPLRLVALLPGRTIASPLLMLNALEDVTRLAGLKGEPDCESVMIADTDLIDREAVYAELKAGHTVADWQEVWTVKHCAQHIPVYVHFSGDGHGGTSFETSLKRFES